MRRFATAQNEALKAQFPRHARTFEVQNALGRPPALTKRSSLLRLCGTMVQHDAPIVETYSNTNT